jgi:tRNA(Ile)-lysidine synthase
VLRSWRRGDAFQPLGARGRKKVSDFFTERKVPRGRRQSIPILERDGDIIWICGMRLDRRFRVTARSGDIALVSYHETDTTP